jgi:type IV pilus assembly protein PilM
MSALAIDIGTYTIKILLADPGQNPQIHKAIEVYNSTGVAVPTDDAQVEKLATLLESIFNDYKLPLNHIRFSLPEAVSSTKVITIPPLSDAELASAIGWQAEQHIPIPPEELSLEYQVLFRPDKKDKLPMRVLMVGVRKKVIERFVEVFNAIGAEPELIETQMVSIVRSLGISPEDPSTLVVHLGASTMDQSVIHLGEIQFVTTHLNGGQLLTKSLEQHIGLDPGQAEQYKRSYGLDESQFQGKVREALLPAVKILMGEIKKSIQFFVNNHPRETVKRVVLSGGSALLPGLVGYVTQELGTEVLVETPFSQSQGEVPVTINQPSMSVCMGLLSRDL